MPRYLVEFEPGKQEEVYRRLKAIGVSPLRKVIERYWVVEAPAEMVPRIQALPGVVRVVEERTYTITAIPVNVKLAEFVRMGGPLNPLAMIWATGFRKNRWATSESRKVLEADVADGMGVTGRGVKVAVLDSGFDTTAQKPFADYLDSTLEGDPVPLDQNGHGTHVLTTIAGDRVPTPFGALEGVAKGVQVAAIKCLGYGLGTARTADVMEAIATAYNWGAKVVNMSLGSDVKPGETHDPETCPLCNLITALSKMGVLFVVAAGNSGKEHASCPGASPGAITVAALKKDLSVAEFSSREHHVYLRYEKPDVAAPGVDIGSSTTGLIDAMEWIDGPRVAFTSGTCQRGDALVLTNPGVPVRIDSIKPGMLVYTLDEKTGKLTVGRVKAVIPQGVRKVYKLVTRNRVNYATENHPYLVLEVGEFGRKWDIYKRIQELRGKTGDWFSGRGYRLRRSGQYGWRRISRELGLPESVVKMYLNHKPRLGVRLVWKPLKELKKGDYIVVLRKLPSENGKSCDLDFVRLFGFLIGDGWLCKHNYRVEFAKSDDEWINQEYKALFEKVFGVKMKETKRSYYVYSKRIWKELEEKGLNRRATEKIVPDWVFELNREGKLAFIAGYVDADGTLTRSGTGYVIKVESASRKLIEGIKVLCYEVGLNAGNVRQRRRAVKAPNQKTTGERTIYVLTISSLQEFRGYLKHPAYQHILNRRVRRVKGVPARLEKRLRELLDTEHFDLARVEKIEPAGEAEVYDIEVEGSHNFIADGIVVHNSMATPHVSGLLALWVEYARRRGVELTRDTVIDIVNHYSEGWRSDVGYGVPKFSWIVDYLR